MKSKSDSNYWISLSDIMTGLMVIFLFISISYISQQNKFVKDYTRTRERIYNELDTTFSDLFMDWDIEIDRDLSIRISDKRANFDIQNYREEVHLNPEFEKFLDLFIPKFLEIVTKEDYMNRIAEVRIEGHTGMQAFDIYDNQYYLNMVKLSQKRSNAVLAYFLNHPYYDELDNEIKDRLRFWLTSNGLSYGKALDSEKEYVYNSKSLIDNTHSPRVEFKIVTTSEKVIQEMADRIKTNI